MTSSPRPNEYRDAWCGQLTAERAGTQARVAGWVHRRRDHGGLIFIDLRDRSGIVQLVFHPETAAAAHDAAHALRSEDVVTAHGTVVRRDPQNVNPNLPTGEIELSVERPRDPRRLPKRRRSRSTRSPRSTSCCGSGTARSTCAVRACRRRLALRHRVVSTMREVLNDRDFLEIETPYLTRSTPEGARDYLVPARVQPGSFYALPQSPQLFKQLLMIARLRALLPDRPLLPRRGHARGPPAGVHAARPRDVVRGRGRRDRLHGSGDGRGVRARRVRRGAAAVAADDVRGSGLALRDRSSGHALRARAPRPRRGAERHRSSRCSPTCSPRAASCAGSTPASASFRAPSSTR